MFARPSKNTEKKEKKNKTKQKNKQKTPPKKTRQLQSFLRYTQIQKQEKLLQTFLG